MNRRFVSFLSLSVLVAIGATGCSDESASANKDNSINRSTTALATSEDAETGNKFTDKEPELGSLSDNAANSDKADSEQEQTVNAANSDSLATISPADSSADQDAADSSNYDVCEKMDKRDVLYFPDYYNEDTAEAILIDPQLHLSPKLTIDDKDELRYRGVRVAYRGDLNSDVRIDFVTKDVKNSYRGLMDHNVYINCGNNQVAGPLIKEALDVAGAVRVIGSESSDWKQIIFYNRNHSMLPIKERHESDGPYHGYNVTFEFQNGFYEVIREVEEKKYHEPGSMSSN